MNATEMSPLNSGSQVKLYYSGKTEVQAVVPKPVTFGPFLVTDKHSIAAMALSVLIFFGSATGVATGGYTLAKVPTDKVFFSNWTAPVFLTSLAITFCSIIGVLAIAIDSCCKKRALNNALAYTKVGE